MAENEHPNATVVREGFQAFATGDMGWLNQHLADDIVWHVGGRSKLSGEYKGKEEVLNLFGRQAQIFSGAPDLELHEVLANDEHAIAIGTARAQDPDGGTVEWKFANVFHVKDGKATEVWGLADETSETDALIDKLVT
jgi:ketosteroid isomerase-like protein